MVNKCSRRRLLFFKTVFHAIYSFSFSHPRSHVLFPPPLSTSALYLTLNAGIVLIKNSPQNARRTQYKHYFVFIVQCLSLELPAYIASHATCIIIEKESARTPNHTPHTHSHILHIHSETDFKCPHTQGYQAMSVYHHMCSMSLYVLTLSRKKAHHF